MITRIMEITSLLKKQDYRCAGNLDSYTKVFWKSENCRNKGVVVADAIFLHINSKHGVEHIVRACRAEYPFLDDVLMILIGNEKNMRMKVNNLMCIDCSDSKIRFWGVKEVFKPEQLALQSFAKQKANMEIQKQWGYGIQKKEYSSWILWVVCALNIYIFVKTYRTISYNEWGISAEDIYKNHQGYRMLSYMFIHSGVRHVFYNMMSLIVVGRSLIKRVGNMDFAVIYIVGGMLAGIFSISYSMFMCQNTSIPTVGASGAIFAVLGGLVCDVFMDETMRFKRTYYVKYAVVTLVLSSLGQNIDIMCHIGGFMCGILLMYFINMADIIKNDRIYIKSQYAVNSNTSAQ